MNGLMRLLTMLFLLALLLIGALLAQGSLIGTAHGSVVLTWGKLVVQTSVPVALVVLLAGVVLAYYVGQLAHWLGGLPGMWRAARGSKQRRAYFAKLDNALLLRELGLAGAAIQRVRMFDALPARREELGLVDTVRRLVGQDVERAESESTEEKQALLDLLEARAAARAKDWAVVRVLTDSGLAGVPDSPRLQALHLKALLNLDNMDEARDFLPQMKPHVGVATFRRLGEVVKGGAPGGALAALQHPWAGFFSYWLTTADDVVPEADGGGDGVYVARP